MRSLLLLALLAAPAAAKAPPKSFKDVAEIAVRVEPAKAKPGEKVTVKFTVSPRPDCWTYRAAPGKNKFSLPTTGDLIFDPTVTDPEGYEPHEDMGKEVDVYRVPVTWTFSATVAPTAKAGSQKVELTGTFIQACNEFKCVPAKAADIPSAQFEVVATPRAVEPPSPPAPAPPRMMPPAARSPVPVPAAAPPVSPAPAPTEARHDGVVKKDHVPAVQHKAMLDGVLANLVTVPGKPPATDIWGFVATAATWGWISLVTPCVFPMIPITVSLFLKQGNKSSREVLKLAGVYSLTIVVVLTLSAFVALQTFRALSVNPWMNIGLGLLLVFFSLSLFGMFDIALPGFLLRWTEKRRGAGGLVGTVFGALAFSIVSFTCVAPFLGAFAGMVESKQFSPVELFAGALAFAAAFASPFFVLAMFPPLIKRLPKSGGWLDTIKAVMGFVEVAAALKFFRTAELRLLSPTQYFTFELCLAGFIVIAAACGLYLLNVYRLPHDEERSHIGVGRLMWAMGFLGLALYLLPGLYKSADGQNQRPGGVVYAWLESFLLPESQGGKGLPWDSDLKHALDAARSSTGGRRLVFVDFTGVNCTNCRLNERNVFSRPEVDELLRQYTLAQLYTDDVPAEFYTTPPAAAARSAEGAANLEFQDKAFQDTTLPLYAILELLPDGKARVLDKYDEGKINDPAKFIDFLRKPLAK